MTSSITSKLGTAALPETRYLPLSTRLGVPLMPQLWTRAWSLRIRPSILRVEIQGHTDDVGEEAANLALSERRAAAVRSYLVAQGIHPSRLVARGYGMSRPKQTNQTEAGRAANRRVELHIQELSAGQGSASANR